VWPRCCLLQRLPRPLYLLSCLSSSTLDSKVPTIRTVRSHRHRKRSPNRASSVVRPRLRNTTSRRSILTQRHKTKRVTCGALNARAGNRSRIASRRRSAGTGEPSVGCFRTDDQCYPPLGLGNDAPSLPPWLNPGTRTLRLQLAVVSGCRAQ
jgi:hypothetical protein